MLDPRRFALEADALPLHVLRAISPSNVVRKTLPASEAVALLPRALDAATRSSVSVETMIISQRPLVFRKRRQPQKAVDAVLEVGFYIVPFNNSRITASCPQPQ